MPCVFLLHAKCELNVIMCLLIVPCFSVVDLFPDQTPTPTRFLKNCEEVGLFNELASSFDQDEDEKRAKNSVRKTDEDFICCVCMFIPACFVLFRELFCRIPLSGKKTNIFSSFILSQMLILSKITA